MLPVAQLERELLRRSVVLAAVWASGQTRTIPVRSLAFLVVCSLVAVVVVAEGAGVVHHRVEGVGVVLHQLEQQGEGVVHHQVAVEGVGVGVAHHQVVAVEVLVPQWWGVRDHRWCPVQQGEGVPLVVAQHQG